tara:strand:+ start:89 stop:358 length:270 start_codon:yes stop_codon:yes gene_type:complete
MKKLINEINKIDNLQDLNKVIAVIKNQQKALKARTIAEKKAAFTVGQNVLITTRDDVLKGVIKKINITKAIVEIGGTRYDVPLTIMEAA